MPRPTTPPHADTLAPYREAAAQFGGTFQATLWASKDKQRTRFDVFADALNLDGATILDVGCGLADFAAHLQTRDTNYRAYVGLEGVPELAAAAREQCLPRVTIVEGNFAADHDIFNRLCAKHRPDAVVFSGSLNTFTLEGAMAVLARAWDALAQGPAAGRDRPACLAFNFLSTLGATPGEVTAPAVRMDPLEFIAWALRRTPLVTLRHDYMGAHDATLVLRLPDKA